MKKEKKPPRILFDEEYGTRARWKEGEFEIVATISPDEYPDLSYLGTFSNKRESEFSICHAERTHNHRQLDYFNPTNLDKSLSTITQKKYVEQDYQRLVTYGDQWHMICLCVAIFLDGHELCDDHVCGIESDSGHEFIDDYVENMKTSLLIEANKLIFDYARKALNFNK